MCPLCSTLPLSEVNLDWCMISLKEHHVRLSSTTGRFFVKADSEQRMRAFQAVIQDEVQSLGQCADKINKI